ncbi:MAG: helicase-associated domain-containing protein [Nocardioides sp.]
MPPSEEPPRTLADQFRDWPDQRLLALLQERPDLATPAPQDSAHLASRVGTRASIARALDLLSRLEIVVLDALALAGPMRPARLAQLINAAPSSVDSACERLVSLALAWDSSSGLRALNEVAALLANGTATSGLQPWSPTPRKPAAWREVIASLSPQATRLLTEVVDAGGTATTSARSAATEAHPSGPVHELMAAGLLLHRKSDVYWVPGDVGLAVRDGKTTRDPVDVPPALALSTRPADLVDKSAAGAAFDAVRRIEVLLDNWSTHPPIGLRSGGLAVRDLKAAAGLIHAEQQTVALLVEVAAMAGLAALGLNDEGDSAWLPTDRFDAWVTRSPARRWFEIAEAWLVSSRLVGKVGTKDTRGKTWNALAPDLAAPQQIETRRAALEMLAQAEPGGVLAAGTGAPSLASALWWHRPRRPPTRDDMVAWTLTEAGILGVLGLGGMSTAGRALLGQDAAAVDAALTPLLPALVDRVMIQTDLTAVAPGPLVSATARTLHLLADIESRGGATVYRFSAQSLRRALDAGWSVTEIHEFLAEVSRTPVPQPLTYLVDDAARTFGSLRVGSAESFIRSDDETLITELMHHAHAPKWGLRRLAPTVIVSAVPVPVLLQRLREIGSAPVVEAADGSVRVTRHDLQRTRIARAPDPSPTQRAARETARMARVAAAIRAGDQTALLRPRTVTSHGPSAALATLRAAVEGQHPVWIGYVDNDGATTERVVTPIRVDGGWLTAYDQRTHERRTFAVHRIASARLMADPPG